MGRNRRKLSPEPFELRISALGKDACGRAEHEEKALSVHGALAGERVKARYLFGRRFRGQAETLEVLEPSEDRVEARCPHAELCAACTMQHMSQAAQLRFKQDWLLACLGTAGVSPDRILEPLAGPRWRYRRKARLSVRNVRAKGRVLVGFRERDTRFVADIAECHVLAQPIVNNLDALSKLVGALSVHDKIPQIEVCAGDEHGAIVIRHLEPLTSADVVEIGLFSRKTGLAVYLQPKGPETVTLLAGGAGPLRYRLPEFDLEFEFGPMDFIQVNGGLNRMMVHRAIELLGPRPDDRVLDLFCGQGNFSLALARHAAEVIGVEGAEPLVKRARENAERNGIDNVAFVTADLYSGEGSALPSGPWHALLLDPPRSGAGPLIPAMAATGANRIVYVSCNPETLSSDIAELTGRHGYRLAAAGIMDMFPHTTHVESIALLTRDEHAGD